jgi:hypothetical protein
MRLTWRPLTCAILSTFFVLLLTACGLAANPGLFAGADAATVSIALTGPSNVTLGTSSQYAAAVTGSSNTGVTWSVNGVTGGSAAVGSISEKGLYAAPVTAPQSSKVTIAATSMASPSVVQSLPVALAAPPQSPGNSGSGSTVTLVLNGPTSVTLGASSQYVATVTGSTNSSVTWSVDGVAGGNAAVGSISANGTYTAPATAPQSSNVTITATSLADASVSESLAVTLTAPPQAPGGNGGDPTVVLALSGATSVRLGASSQYAAKVTGTSDVAVTWSVDGTVGGNTSIGLISTTGLYKAPSTSPQSSKVTITATSVADPSVAQSLAVALDAPPPPPPPAVTVAVSGATSVTLGASSQYAAKVTGTSNVAVTWSVNGIVGGTSKVGFISTKGFYSAPSTAPQSSHVTITATSTADPSVAQSLAVALKTPPPPPPIIALVLSGATEVTLGTSSQYAATVTGSTNTGVTWRVNGVAGGNSSVGSISTNGRYIAPAKAPGASKVTITATSVADPSVVQSLAVALKTPPPPPPIIALVLSGATEVTLGTSSQYAATVTGSTNTGVSWSVNGVAGGNASVGSISTKGRYIAPAKAPGASKVTITATSVADPSVVRSLAVALDVPPPPPPTVTLAVTGATSVTLGTSSQYAATVTGTSDIAVTWSVNGVVGGDVSVGLISTKGRYTAPATAPRSSKITIMATSLADPAVSQSLAVALVAPTPPVNTVTLALSGAMSVTLGTSSQYAATVKGSTNTGVIWSVDGVIGGDASSGSISTKGLYTAPATVPGASKVTITATSVADPSVAQSLAVALDAPPPPPAITLVLSGATKVTLGNSSQYAAVVTGSTNTGVTWSVNGVAGGNATDGSISAQGLYAAPATAPQPSTITITATSMADPSVAKSLVTTLVAPVSSSGRIPSNAIASSDLDASTRWQWNHDAGTPGSSQGTTQYPVSGLSPDNVARGFSMTYSGHGGEIYHVSFATDTQATHFVYDAYVYVADPSQLANLEMDMNDVMADGRTVILGTQCSTYSKSWEYTYQSGGHPHWRASNIPCDPKKWAANTWHHIQIASQRDGNGIATYDWVGVDGVYTDFQNATVDSALSLGWAKGDLLINFQIDGANSGSGSNTLYTDKLIVYRW